MDHRSRRVPFEDLDERSEVFRKQVFSTADSVGFSFFREGVMRLATPESA
jgi:hypothetical protein